MPRTRRLASGSRATTAAAEPVGRTPSWSLSAEPGREFSFRRDVLACGVCDWTYRMEPAGQGGTLLTESYEVKKPDWRITNWFNGVLLGVADRDEDLRGRHANHAGRHQGSGRSRRATDSLGRGHHLHPGEERAMTAVDWTARWRGDEGQHYKAEADRYDDINRALGDGADRSSPLSAGERCPRRRMLDGLRWHKPTQDYMARRLADIQRSLGSEQARSS